MSFTPRGASQYVSSASSWGERVTRGNGAQVTFLKEEKVEFNVRLNTELGPTVVELHTIESMKPKSGNGAKVMQRLCSLADQMGVTLALEAMPFQPRMGGKPIPVDKLKRFYQRFGFRTVYSEEFGDAYMFRYPK